MLIRQFKRRERKRRRPNKSQFVKIGAAKHSRTFPKEVMDSPSLEVSVPH